MDYLRGIKLKTLKKCINFFLYGSRDRKGYYSIISRIRHNNLQIFSLTSICIFIIHALVMASSFIFNVVPKNQICYVIICCSSLLFFIMSRTLLTKFPRLILPSFYALALILYIYTAYIGIIINRTEYAVTFCVLLFALPILLIDRPIRLTLFLITITAAFCTVSLCLKNREKSTTDLLNALACCFSALIVFFYIVNIKMHDIMQNMMVEKERDTDSVTGLFNKKATERLIENAIRKSPEAGTFLILDLDDFKHINDTYGHKTGDDILFGMGFCVYNIFSTKDICGRFGGDEFIIYMPGEKSIERVERYASRLQTFIQHEIVLADPEKTVNCSLGISRLPVDGTNYDELLTKADKALYRAKKSGKNKFCFYDPKLDSDTL